MFNPLLADGFNIGSLDLWYALPVIIAVSLVYAATRHERLRPIFVHAARVAFWLTGFMVVFFGVIELISWWL